MKRTQSRRNQRNKNEKTKVDKGNWVHSEAKESLHEKKSIAQGVERDGCAVVFSWHVGNSVSDVRWGDDVVGGNNGNLFKAAVNSVRETHPDLPIYLFTNGRVIDSEILDTPNFHLVRVDLAEEAGLTDLLSGLAADAKVGFVTKLQSILTGYFESLTLHSHMTD